MVPNELETRCHAGSLAGRVRYLTSEIAVSNSRWIERYVATRTGVFFLLQTKPRQRFKKVHVCNPPCMKRQPTF